MTADPFGLAVRFGLYLVLALLFGLPVFALQALRGQERVLRLGLLLPALALAAALLSVAQIAALAASMSGAGLGGIDRSTIAVVLSAGSLGLAWKVRMVALAVVLVAGLARAPVAVAMVRAAAGLIALVSLAWVGHGTMGDDAQGWVHLGADILHLAAAGLWLGALAGLVALVARPLRRTTPAHLALCARALTGFAQTGTLIVATLVGTGLINAWALIGLDRIGSVPATPYGRLLLVKLVMFGAMLLLAAANRFRLAPGLARAIEGEGMPEAATRRLRLSLAVETGCIVAILALVSWLGTLPPTGEG